MLASPYHCQVQEAFGGLSYRPALVFEHLFSVWVSLFQSVLISPGECPNCVHGWLGRATRDDLWETGCASRCVCSYHRQLTPGMELSPYHVCVLQRLWAEVKEVDL